MPSVVGELTKGAAFNTLVEGVSVGAVGEDAGKVLTAAGDDSASYEPSTGSATEVTAAAVLAANVIPVGDDGARGIKDNTGGVELIGTVMRFLTSLNDANGSPNLAFIPLWASGLPNFIIIANASAGSHPIIAPFNVGGDSDVNLKLQSKGAGTIELEDDTNITGDLGVTGTVDAVDVANHDHDGTAAGGVNIDGGDLTGEVTITNGGTGQNNKAEAFDALSPTTTKGDIIVHEATDNLRLAVGADGTVLTADSGEAKGVKWAAGGGGGAAGEFHSVLYAEADEVAIHEF